MIGPRYKTGDVVAEIGTVPCRKFVVERVMEDGYIFRNISSPGSRVGYSTKFAWEWFVKVGEWKGE